MKKYSSRTKGSYRPLWSNKIVIFLLLGLLLAGMLMPWAISSVGSWVLYPAHVVRVWVDNSSTSLAHYVREKQQLKDEIITLERLIAERSGTRASIDRLLDENQELRSLLQIEEPDRIAARVLARPNQLPYDVLQIDKGRRDGIENNAPVFYGVDQVIGFVSHVAPTYSLVTLVTTPQQRSTAFILGADIYTVAEGVGGGVLRLRVPQSEAVEIGDLVILPAVTSGLFGVIDHIETAPTEPQKFAYVTLPINISGLRYVSIGSDPIVPLDADAIKDNVELIRDTLLRVPVEQLNDVDGSATSSIDVEVDDGSSL